LIQIKENVLQKNRYKYNKYTFILKANNYDEGATDYGELSSLAHF
jgi:hypothetical protein